MPDANTHQLMRAMSEPIKLLWVDDDPMIHTIVEFAFQDESDIDLRLCSTGREAQIAVQDIRPDLVLLDVVMPDMDGPATLSKLRSLPSMETVPVVFVTAESETQSIQDLLCLGAVGVISKPIDVVALRVQVRTFATDHASPRVMASTENKNSQDEEPVDLELLRRDYAASLADRLQEIRNSSEQYFRDQGDSVSLSMLHRQTHSLAGSAGTFGYAKLGKVARTLEHVTTLSPGEDPHSIDQSQLRLALARLFSCALDIVESS